MTDKSIFVETSVDYGMSEILVIFDEEYTEEQVSNRVKEIHPNVGEIIYFEQPSDSSTGYKNSGSARFQYNN